MAKSLVASNSTAKYLGVFFLSWILLSVISYYLLFIPYQNLFDFYPRWVGAREVLNRNSPYSEKTTLSIQQGMYNRQLEPSEDQQRFAYTPMITWLLLPFWLMPFSLSVSLWCGLQLTLLLASPLILISILEWKIKPSAFLILVVFSILIYRYPINAYVLGQFIPFVLASILIALWGIKTGNEIVSSTALLGAMVRPEVSIIPVLAVLFVAFQKGQKKVVGFWIGGMLILWLITRFWIGLWEGEFVNGILAYQKYSDPIWPPSLLGNPGFILALLFLVLVWGIWMFSELRKLRHDSYPIWFSSVAVIISLLVLPQTGNYTLILGLIPAWLIIWSNGNKIIGGALLILLILTSPWLFHLWVTITPFEHLFIPLSLLVCMSLFWINWKKDQDSVLG
jgi:hypothetical protein